MKRTVIVDGDGPIYTAASNAEYTVPFNQPGQPVYDAEGNYLGESTGGLTIYEVDWDKAKADLRDIVAWIQDSTHADEVVMAISNYDRPWRKQLMPWYKANRSHMRKPAALKMLREFTRETWRTFERPALEGDDVCGILLTMPDSPLTGERIVASADKDMRTLPGKHFHLKRRLEFEVSPAEADRWHMLQTLTGDLTDNYKGCPGIGEVRAEKLLDAGRNIREWWPIVVGAFKKAELTEEYALLHAQIARICRHTDWDFSKKEVIPWQSPK